tara:strand:+ start:187 stop:663 length:477 start_codon:yes stop_codon:yes gene_type:complete
MKNTYKNRYGDEYTFTRDENHDILWEGNFKYCRFGMPNDYTRAYEAYLDDTENKMSLEDFKKAVHVYDNVRKEHSLGRKYVEMVDSLKNEIDMVDPSGGPYISRGMSMDSFGFKSYVVKDFKPIDTGYKIITEKCAYCNQAAGIHKMGCETRKIQINL